MTRFAANYESNDLLCQSTFLDPRYKKVGFRTDGQFTRTSKEVQQKVATMSNTAQQPVSATELVPQDENESQDALWLEFDEEVRGLSGTGSSTSISIIETDRYKNELLINRKEDPIKYWVDRKNVYPNLFQLVLRRFLIPATSVPCKRIFSKTGAIMTERKNRLQSN